MAARFFTWLKSPAAREYFFSAFISIFFSFFDVLQAIAGTHFWGPVRTR